MGGNPNTLSFWKSFELGDLLVTQELQLRPVNLEILKYGAPGEIDSGHPWASPCGSLRGPKRQSCRFVELPTTWFEVGLSNRNSL
jgi:hypothetical protein